MSNQRIRKRESNRKKNGNGKIKRKANGYTGRTEAIERKL